jgi:hypothetical protein
MRRGLEVGAVDLPEVETSVCIHHGFLGDDLDGRRVGWFYGGPEGQAGHCGHHELEHVHRQLSKLRESGKSYEVILDLRWATLRLNCKLRLMEIYAK